MARPLRIEFPGALYHVTARGNEKREIFLTPADYGVFTATLAEIPEKYGVIVHAYVLMPNHYHLLIETPRANLSRAIHYLNTRHTVCFNLTQQRVGHLFQGRYKAFLIEKDPYLLAVSGYVHRNPLRAGLVADLLEYPWSSYRAYVLGEARPWLTTSWILDQFGPTGDVARREFQTFVEGASAGNPFSEAKAGMILGGDAFMRSVMERTPGAIAGEIPETRRLQRSHSPEEIIGRVARTFGLPPGEIQRRGGVELPRRIAIYLLKRFTDLPNHKLGEAFGIGYTAVSVSAMRLRKAMEKDVALADRVKQIEAGVSCIK